MKLPRSKRSTATRPTGSAQPRSRLGRVEEELRRARKEAGEALEQQAATAEILRVISRTPTDLAPVFATILDNAVKLCEGDVAVLWQYDGTHLRFAAHKGGSAPGAAYLRDHPLTLGTYNPTPQAGLERRAVHVLDVFADARYRPLVPLDHHRTLPNSGTVLAVPLVKQNELLGVITIWRFKKRLFSEKQLAMVDTFAAQAVIAIDNVRLFNETKEALERQTATAEILRVITSSPTDVEPVMVAVVESAARLAGADHAIVGRAEGGTLHWLASHGCPLPPSRPIIRALPSGRAMLELQTTQVEDVAQIVAEFPPVERAYRELGVRTIIATPLIRAGSAVGVLLLRRTELRPFTDKEIALLKTFADQAAIAIENVRLFNETKEALEQQTATGEILRVIAASPTDTQPVFDAVCKSAARLCDAFDALIFRLEDDKLRIVGHYGAIPIPEEAVPVRGTASGRAIVDQKAVHVLDLAAEIQEYPEGSTYARRFGFRTVLIVPLLREGASIGVIQVRRAEVRPFSEKQVQLMRVFADQAVIAIQNVRLFQELQARNRQLTEALEQQTATSEVLKIISRSTFDLPPVLETLIENAVRLCAARSGVVYRFDGQLQRLAAAYSMSPEFRDFVEEHPIGPGRGTAAGRALLEGRTVHIHDVSADPDYQYPASHAVGDIGSILGVPMLREGVPIGVMTIWRNEVRPFTDKQIQLLTTFADQSAIAIENVRLFQEIQTRNRELTESLQQQTATAEILRAISSSPTDLAPVFDAVANNAARLCDAPDVVILRVEGELLRFATSVGPFGHNIGPDLAIPITRDSVASRAVADRATIHVHDLAAESDDEYPTGKALQQRYGHHTMVATPLLRGDKAVGVIAVLRREMRPFSDKQIALLRTFADQAVIAIENVRLFNEIKDSLEQQTATAEILRVISGSPTSTGPVFSAILESGTQLCEADMGILFRYEAGVFRTVAMQVPDPVFQEFLRQPIQASAKTGLGRLARDKTPVHVPDLIDDDAYRDGDPLRVRSVQLGGVRTWLGVPMLKEGELIGAIAVYRQEVRPFDERQISLLKTFADQAVIAVENVRLFNEIQEKSRELEKANQHKSGFLANMSHELRTPLNAIIGFTRIVMRRSKEQLDAKQYENLEKILFSAEHLLQLINAILDLSKVEAGRVEVRASELSLGSVLEQCVRTVEPLVKAPAVCLLKEFEGELPHVYLDEEKLRQIVLNLLSNAVKFTERGTVRVQAKCNGESFEVAVADTGIGIPADKLEHVFEEFAQADASSTRVYGGTGLGLTIARRLARLMGGDIAVESEPGAGSKFTLTLPVHYRPLA